ncbi:MAG: DUF2924 domain-containing protein [Candidatus Omnitrophota bacterium]
MAKGTALSRQIIALKNAPAEALIARYRELYGEDTAGNHKTYLWRKIAYKLQELEKGSLSVKARNRINELIKEYDPINNKALKPNNPILSSSKDKRIPIPGTVITKTYKRTEYQVKVLEKGFEFNSKIFKSLSAIAEKITGAHWNGYLFFNL